MGINDGITWDLQSAKRIGNAVRLVEANARIFPGIDSQDIRPGMVASVKTPSTFPASYSGSTPVLGKCVEDRGDGTIVEICDCWIQERNDGILTTDTVYEGRMARVYAGDSGAAPLFRVQSSATASDYVTEVMPWAFQYVYFEGADFPNPFQTKMLVHVETAINFYDGNSYLGKLPIAREADKYFIAWYADGMPMVSLSDATYNQSIVDNNTKNPTDLEDAFARACSLLWRNISLRTTFRKSTAYFINPVTGNKVYLYQQVFPPKYYTEWGHFTFHKAQAQALILFNYCKRVVLDGVVYVVVSNTYSKRNGQGGTYYLWFSDYFNLFPNNVNNFSSPFTTMVSPVASGCWLQSTAFNIYPRHSFSQWTSWTVTQVQHRTSPYNLAGPAGVV